MARIADKKKMIAVKQKLIDIIIRDGSTNASISKIAREAEVSVGYMYRHYESKESLIFELYTERLVTLSNLFIKNVDQHEKANGSILGFYQEIYEMLQKNENDFLFLLKMMIDYSVILKDNTINELKSSLTHFKNKFNAELRNDINEEYIYMSIMGNFLFFINFRKKGIFNSKITQEEILSLGEIAFNSVRLW